MATLEFRFEGEYLGNPCIHTIEVEDAGVIPREGEYVHVDGYRKVMRVEHYYGVVVSNGTEDVRALPRGQKPTARFQTVYVTLSARKKTSTR